MSHLKADFNLQVLYNWVYYSTNKSDYYTLYLKH